MGAREPGATRADQAVAALARRPIARPLLQLDRIVPSGRSTTIAVTIAALAVGALLVARETGLFAVQRVEVIGASPAVADQIRSALRKFDGANLVTLDGSAVERTLADLPVVATARYDRDFPHTLRIFVRPERPVAVLRRGTESWLVSARARVMARLRKGARRSLPRVWVPHDVDVELGGTLAGDPAQAVGAVSPLAGAPLRGRVRSARAGGGELTLVLRSGLELRLGDARNLALKLAIGARVAALIGPGDGYVDVSVPGRPVARQNPLVGG